MNFSRHAFKDSADLCRIVSMIPGKAKNSTQSSDLLELMMNTFPGYISWISADLKYLGINQAIADTFGVKRNEVVGKSLGSINTNASKDNFTEKVREFFAAAATEASFEVQLFAKNHEYWHLVSARKYNDGKEAIFIGIDITEKKEFEWALLSQQEARAQDAKMASLGAMASGIAHEIKSPLSALIGNAELAGENARDPEKVKKYTDKVLKTADRIHKIIKSLQVFSRKGEADPFETASLKEIVDDTIELCRDKLRHQNIAYSLDDIPKSLQFECRPTQISQVLLNLIKNAIDAIEKIHEKWIHIGFQDNGANFVLSVTDAGPGIAPEVIKHLMEPFFTTKANGKGTGIGLSLSRRIVHDHSGNFAIDTNSRNTRFVLTLPKKQAAPAKELHKSA